MLDDEKRFTEELTEFLQNSGFQTYEANTRTQGISLLKKQSIDLLILDVRLPGVNGLDILKEVKVKKPSRNRYRCELVGFWPDFGGNCGKSSGS